MVKKSAFLSHFHNSKSQYGLTPSFKTRPSHGTISTDAKSLVSKDS